MERHRRSRPFGLAQRSPGSAPQTDVILLAVRWYLRFGRSYRDLEELLAERGIDVDHVTLSRWARCTGAPPS